MKTKLYLLFIVLFISTLTVFSQNTKIVDQRAIGYYSEKELNEMPIYKIHQINYLLQDSYIVPDEFKSTINTGNVDGFGLAAFRKEKERVKVNVDIAKEGRDQNLRKEYVILKSFEEVDKAFSEIKSKYSE